MRRFFIVASLFAALGVVPAAAEILYTAAAFQAAQGANEPILVWVHATWCPTRAKQAPILSKLESDPAYKGLQVFKIDFDSQKDVARGFGVQMQSTLTAFHGATEEARSTGQTDETIIRALVAKTAE